MLSTGTAAVAANLGILGHDTSEPVGELNAQTVAELAPSTDVEPVVITVDEIVPVPMPDATPPVGSDDLDDDRGRGFDDDSDDDSDGAGTPGPFAQPAPQPVPATTYSDSDDDHDDDHYDDDHLDEHEDEHEEVEDD